MLEQTTRNNSELNEEKCVETILKLCTHFICKCKFKFSEEYLSKSPKICESFGLAGHFYKNENIFKLKRVRVCG